MNLSQADRRLINDPEQRRHWVRYQLAMRGKSLAEVAQDAGVSRQCLYQVFQKSYPRMEFVVAQALGLEPSELFPDRYDANGLPLYRSNRITKTINNSSQARNVNKREVA